MPSLALVKNFKVEPADFDSLIAISAAARSLAEEFKLHSIEVPPWLAMQCNLIREEIRRRNADNLRMQLAEAEAKLAALATAEEKRQALRDQIATLRHIVDGGGPVQPNVGQ